MLSFQWITDAATPEYLEAWQLYEGAFPPEERRSPAQQQTLLSLPGYSFLSLHQEKNLVGLMGIWRLSGFTFLEHFAIAPTLRGHGLGLQALHLLQEMVNQLLVLEVEPASTSSMASRRVAFYQRAGLSLNDFPYQQPPYSPEKPWIVLQLMSYPTMLTSLEFELVKAQLYKVVYGH